HPDCQYGFGLLIVSVPLVSRISGYHSPHFPALQPGGLDGTFTTCVTSSSCMRRLSQSSTSRSTKTALGPASVVERRTSYRRISASLPNLSVPKASLTPGERSGAEDAGNPGGRFESGRNSGKYMLRVDRAKLSIQ